MLNVAIVGTGALARAHLSAAATLEGVRVTAVVGPGATELAMPAGLRAVESIDRFLASKPGEVAAAAIVCLASNTRLVTVGRLLQNGIAVLIEPPLAHRLADAQALLGMSYQYRGTPCVAGFAYRFMPAVSEMRRSLDARVLGTLLRVEVILAEWRPQAQADWASDPAISGGGAMVENGSHALDLFRHLVGDCELLTAQFHDLWPKRGETTAAVLLRAAGSARHPRAIGIVQAGWAEPERRTLTITGTQASLHYDLALPTQMLLTPVDGPQRRISVEPFETRYARQLRAFEALIRGTSPEVKPATFEEATQVARLVDQAIRTRQTA